MKGCQATGYLNKSKQCGFTCFDPESSSRQQQQQITDNKVMSDPGEKQYIVAEMAYILLRTGVLGVEIFV